MRLLRHIFAESLLTPARTAIITEKAITAETTKTGITAAAMKAAATDAMHLRRLSRAEMWERPAAYTTAEPSMTVHSLIRPMTGASLSSLSAERA